ncbi:MAG: HAMP domain-containing histidine kinase [Pseudomonadota bacterium]|nr:HAMP domain-containing histidine kinase [Pseudomonadota bacterium]
MTLARAVTDGEDRLLSADGPLASLQLRCGGTIPGAIAIPPLAELVRKARRMGLRMARSMAAQDGRDAIRAWVEIEPRTDGKRTGGGEPGCTITVRHWHAVPLAHEDPAVGRRRRTAVDRTQADLTARLDARQCLLAVAGEAPDLAALIAAMQRGLGRPWTDFVTISGEYRGPAMDFGPLDGATVEISGSPRKWRAKLVPLVGPGSELASPAAEMAGFDLYFLAETPFAVDGGRPGDLPSLVDTDRVFGRGLAPALRQPIARIIANAETIRMRMAGPLEEQYTGFAADIVAAGEHLLALVEDLADLEVIEADDFSTVTEAIDLADVARRAASILSGRARSKQITIVAPAQNASMPARADLRRTLQVLLNLIGNALIYAPKQTRITIELAQFAGCAQVTVADQGSGLNPEQQSRLFGKFERLGRSGGGGSGLGLYISRRLARAMGGDVIAASAPNEGARFTLSLPGGEIGD